MAVDNRSGIVDFMNSLLSDAEGPHSEAQERVDVYRSDYYNAGENASTDLPSTGPGSNKRISRALVKDVMRTVEGSIPSLVQPFIEKDIAVIESNDGTEESEQLSREVADYVNYIWNKKSNPLETIETIARNIQVDGTSWTRVGWDSKGFPTVDVIPFEAVIPDPSAYTLEDMKFVIYRRKVTISDILSNPEWFGKHTLDDLSPLGQTKSTQHEPETHGRAGSEDGFNMGQRASDMIEVFEFYGKYDMDEDGIAEPVVIVWADNMLLHMFESPYSGFWNPFDAGVYLRRPYTIYGSGVSELIGEHQRTRQTMLRGILDNMNKSNNGTRFIKKGAFDITNMKRYEKHAPVVEVNHNSQEPLGNAFWDGGFNQIPPEVYKLMESYEVEEENLTGITKYAVGSDSRSLNQTATGVSIISSMSQRRLVFITQHIAGHMARIMKKWVLMHGDINLGMDLEDVDLYIKAGTAGLAAKKGQDISNMLTALAPHTGTIDPMIVTDLTADLAETYDLNSTAKRIRESAEAQRKEADSPEGQAMAQEEAQMAKEIAMRAEAAKIAKDESNAHLNNAKAQETQIDTAVKAYGGNS